MLGSLLLACAAALPGGDAAVVTAPHAVVVEPPTGVYERPPKTDPPRWRFRALIATGVGGGVGGVRTVVFPTQLELGARIWGPLSATISGMAMLSGREVTSCGASARANAATGAVGLRADLFNSKSASWIDPFIEAHAGVGGQTGFSEPADPCAGSRVFATGGGRIGLDAWFGRVAVTAQLTYDYLPIAAPLAFSLGASVLLH